jgi:ABC-type multidrug transport system fused ATPase/permease subunit
LLIISIRTIIPQDPILFEGNLRNNLDPLELYKDEEILEAVKKVGLLDSMQKQSPSDEGTTSSSSVLIAIDDSSQSDSKSIDKTSDNSILNMEVAESGNNFSQGQRQLIW